MPGPVPNREADDAARFSISTFGTGWKLPAHKTHLVVMLRDEDGTPALDTISAFTSLVAAVAKASRTVGVYWGGAGATHDPGFFCSLAEQSDVTTRIMLWNGVSIGVEADGRLGILSLGMKQLGLPDLHLRAKPSEGNAALGTFFDFLAYMAQLGTPLPEGNTIGRSATERLPVEYRPSPIDPAVQVIRLELP